MKQSKLSNSQNILVFILMALSVVGRLVPHPPNLTPVSATAIWSGFRLDPKLSYIIVIGAMLVSDLFLGFHQTMPYVYGSLLLTTWLAQRVKRTTVGNVLGVTLVSAVLFFLITNFGAWLSSPIYAKNWGGLFSSYIAAIPFFRMSLVGDLAYVTVFFGLEAAVLTLHQKSVMLKNAK